MARLDVLTETDCRQIGAFAPVPQLLSQKKLAFWSKAAASEPPRSPECQGFQVQIAIPLHRIGDHMDIGTIYPAHTHM